MADNYIDLPEESDSTITGTVKIEATNGDSLTATGTSLNVNVTNTAPISGTVKIEDTAGNTLTSTAGALNVNSVGSSTVSGTVNTNLNGLSAFQTSQYAVSTTAVQLTVTPLSNRSSMSIKVTTTSATDAVYVSGSNAVTTSNGYALFNGDSLQLDIIASHQVWVIGSNPGQVVYVMEIGS